MLFILQVSILSEQIYIYIHLLTVCQISSYITKNCFKTAMKLDFDCKKALAARALPWTPMGELPLTADPLAYCLVLSALGKGLEFFIQEYENNSYRNEKFLFWHPGFLGENIKNAAMLGLFLTIAKIGYRCNLCKQLPMETTKKSI